MQSHARVAVIGGGVVGCSVLYHLTKLGWRDVILIERDELTSGSSWHAAGGFHRLNSDPNVAKLQSYTIGLYKEIEEISGQSCGLHLSGGVLLAGTSERMDYLKVEHAKGRHLGMETELISPNEARDLFPFIDPAQFQGALFDPLDGHLDPAGTTHAYAKAAQENGAEIYLRNRVVELVQRPTIGWDVVTEKGTVQVEHVVNAGGLWAREVGHLVGLELPVLAMEHMYLLTEDLPEVVSFNEEMGKEVCHAIDFEAEIYMRQERRGMLIGIYEKACVPWSTETTPWNFGKELLQPDLERVSDSLALGFRHCPALRDAGIRQIINGPFTFSPDGNPLIGPVLGTLNFWVACGVMAGFSQGGGVGLALANWMVFGDPGFDVWGMDVSRFGDWATKSYTNAKVRENYSRRFQITFPNEELLAARPLMTTPIYSLLKDSGAVFGVSYGLEYPLWFAPKGEPAIEDVTFRRSNAFNHISSECYAVRESVGISEISGFAKYIVSGERARDWISKIFANNPPPPGRIKLSPLLNPGGKIIGDFTISSLGQEEYYIFGSGIAENYHIRWFNKCLPPGEGAKIKVLGLNLVGFSVAGPNSRKLLDTLTAIEMSNAQFPHMSITKTDIGMIPVLIGRISFTGELGYEVWCAPEYQNTLFDLLMRQGKDLGIKLFGSRALRSLSLEKGYGTWAYEYRPTFNPIEAGLEKFVAFDKGDFIGRDALIKERDKGTEKRLVLLRVDAVDADVINDEPIWHNNRVVSYVTSGGYGHFIKQSLALSYLPIALVDDPSLNAFEIEIMGQRCPAKIHYEIPFDPKGERMRS